MNSSEKLLTMVATYNEADNISNIIQCLSAADDTIDILIIDDASPDGTGEIADQIASHVDNLFVLHGESKRGLAPALLQGFQWALDREYDVIVNLDADLSHSPKEVPGMVHALAKKDLVIGSRYLPGSRILKWTRRRYFLSRMAGFYLRVTTGLPFSDPTSGFRAYRISFLRRFLKSRVRSRGFFLHAEMAYRAWEWNLQIGEQPITFVDRRAGVTKMNLNVLCEGVIAPWKLRRFA